MPAPLWKEGRVKLEGEEFTAWRERVLDRDKWRCRRCDNPQNLHVHHIRKRSSLRRDTLENGITLCARCHDAVENKRGKLVVIHPETEGQPVNANGIVRFRYASDCGCTLCNWKGVQA